MIARALTALLAGVLFGLGFGVSGLVNPAKVQAFLDVAGNWDPSLAFVMAAAVAVTLLGYRLAIGRGRPLLDSAFALPTSTHLDVRLLGGSALFGVGWGLVGACPGPAVSAASFGAVKPLAFVAAMAAGMILARWLAMPRTQAPEGALTSANTR